MRIVHIVLIVIVILVFYIQFSYFVQNHEFYIIGVTGNGIESTDMSESVIEPDIFSAEGVISSLTYLTEIPTNLTNTLIELHSSSEMTEARKFILFGDWNLEVKEGKVTNFAANFDQLLEDGGLKHSHSIVNFVQNKNMDIRLSSDLWVLINGTSDIKYNGTITWSTVDTEILISNGRTITIWIDNKATDNHFQGQPIYGIVRSIK